jgi:hypothetical protein
MFYKLGLFFILLFSQTMYASDPSSTELVEDMREKIQTLNEDKHFSFVDLRISEEDLQAISKFKIDYSKEGAQTDYNRFGNLHLMQDELPDFLRCLGNNDEQLINRITQIIIETSANVVEAFNKDTAWITVRTNPSCELYDIPRWHSDAPYFLPYKDFQYKFATVLKGRPTLFHQLPQDLRGIFNYHLSPYHRVALMDMLADSYIETASLGQGAFFIVGDRNYGAVHSEPKFDLERLFFSVLPGTESEIHQLDTRWNTSSNFVLPPNEPN